MTENKRFHFGYVLGDTGLIDEQAKEHRWFIENCCSANDLKKNWITVCEKLNELNDENEQLKRQIGNLEHTRDFVGDVCADCNRLENEVDELKSSLDFCRKNVKRLNDNKKELNDENEQLKSELESAMGEINHCHLIIETLVENEGVNDYFDLLNKCDKELLKEMGWE